MANSSMRVELYSPVLTATLFQNSPPNHVFTYMFVLWHTRNITGVKFIIINSTGLLRPDVY